MIHLQGVHKSYRVSSQPVQALRGVDLHIAQPGFYAVMGPSGSGKSTLLHLLAGLDQPDAGVVQVSGQDLSKLSERELTTFRRGQVGIVFQQFNLIPTLTARQNVELPGIIDGRSTAWCRQRSSELLEQLGVLHRADHRPEALSGGEQQRVAIARALIFNPPVLLADEPTGNLDSASSQRLWTLLRELASARQMTVLMVTHEPAAAAYCRHVHVLSDGRVAGEFEVDGLDAAGVAHRYQQLGR